MARLLSAESPLKRPAGVALLVGVTLAHLWLGDELMEDRLGFGAGQRQMQRIEVTYVRELALAPPPQAPAPPRRAARPRKAVAAKAPASAPRAASEPSVPVLAKVEEPAPPPLVEPVLPPRVEPVLPPLGEPSPPMAVASEPAASAPDPAPTAPTAVAAIAPAPASAPAFEWPPSTRLTYGLTGYYRGDVQGSASVEWIRSGLRYQVHLEAVVGPPFAPLLVRRASSEGELSEAGLSPRRFEGEQRVAFRSRRWAMTFEPDRVYLPDGREVQAAPGVQDEASLFVQLTWLFTTQPHLLQPGRTVEVPLALPRRVEPWRYDVVGEETLQMPFAQVPTMHVKPRRLAKPAGELTAEMWFAPGLQYLPVRILIHQDAQTFIDLTLQRAPQQASTR
ncbi:MAG: DUF3108 domain-containing protein [Burkholderiaceae bacterium]|nr:DUF3108 domain-containing protein [Burkholderiaceae bacterium]